jgi:modulator of FtsH protease
VSAAYETERWTDLFVGAAGASAALAGLVFVAVSINLDDVLAGKGLPDRALATLTQLLAPLIVSILVLIPQSTTALGAELLGVGLASVATAGGFTWRSLPPQALRSWVVGRTSTALLGTVPYVVAGVSLLAEAGGGLYWVAGGVVLGVLGGVINAWVLLVEIRR